MHVYCDTGCKISDKLNILQRYKFVVNRYMIWCALRYMLWSNIWCDMEGNTIYIYIYMTNYVVRYMVQYDTICDMIWYMMWYKTLYIYIYICVFVIWYEAIYGMIWYIIRYMTYVATPHMKRKHVWKKTSVIWNTNINSMASPSRSFDKNECSS